ncbi:MAG TPA: ThuA domain-containing protein [Armatimonadetes bacterium]|nr:ThuA domain-containing protein [Armatimonadota bacterium]
MKAISQLNACFTLRPPAGAPWCWLQGFIAASVLVVGPSTALPAPQPGGEQAAAANKTLQVLIVTGVDYPGHHWWQTTPVLVEQLQRDPRFEVRVVQDPHFLDSSAIHRYDVIVLHFMNWKVPAPGATARANLKKFVQGGKGLVLVHFACGAWQDWPEFLHLAGRVWDPKRRGHDPRGPFRVEIANPEHPITQGLQPFVTDDELYTCLTGDQPVEVLATARSKVDGQVYPMAFVLTYGQGRVFHCTLGHDAKALANPSVGELYRRGTAWAAGHPPVFTKPN